MKATRRQFVQQAAQTLAGTLLSASLPGTAAASTLADLHLEVAARVKTLANEKLPPLRVMLPEGSEENVQSIAHLFSKLTGVEVSLRSVALDDINTQMFLAASTRQDLYDVALPATFGIPDLAETKSIADLSALRQKHEPKALLEQSLYNVGSFYSDRFYGYQTDGDVYLMFYNQSLVNDDRKKAYADTFAAPYQIPKTWEELDQQLIFFHQPDKNIYGGALFRTPDYLVWEFWARFHAKGALPLANDLRPQLNQAEGLAALDEMREASKSLYPQANVNGLFANWKAFAEGNIYANIGWGGTQKYLNSGNSKVRGNMLFASTPGGYKDGTFFTAPYFNWGWNYTVAANSKYKELAYLFTLFAASPAPSTLAVRQKGGYFDPFRNEHYQDENIQQIYSKPFLAAHKLAMDNCIPDFYLHGQSSYFGELKKYLSLAMTGDISSKTALDTCCKRWETIHLKNNLEKQVAQWQKLKRHYPKALQES